MVPVESKPGKVSGQSAKYDPSYTITNDLDPSLYDDTNFNVVGLHAVGI